MPTNTLSSQYDNIFRFFDVISFDSTFTPSAKSSIKRLDPSTDPWRTPESISEFQNNCYQFLPSYSFYFHIGTKNWNNRVIGKSKSPEILSVSMETDAKTQKGEQTLMKI